MVEIVEEDVTGPEYVKRFAKQMLKNTIFIGTFNEKRFVENLKAYRDVVCISGDETEFIQNLMAVKKRIEREFGNLSWIGITGPHGIGTPAGYNLWVELPVEVFGTYWFKIKTVEFRESHVCLKLDVIRPVNESSPGSASFSSKQTSDLSFNISKLGVKIWMKEKLLYLFDEVLTIQNMKTTVIFISVLLSTLLLGVIDIIKYLMEYFLKLVNEFSKLVHTLTPIVISVINLCGRTIFGLFQLIATLFKRNPPPQPVYNAYVTYDPKGNMPDPFNFNRNYSGALPNISNTPRIREISY